ncbi:MAG: proline-rich domain-containing protein [Micromonosporaceae bacterium]
MSQPLGGFGPDGPGHYGPPGSPAAGLPQHPGSQQYPGHPQHQGSQQYPSSPAPYQSAPYSGAPFPGSGPPLAAGAPLGAPHGPVARPGSVTAAVMMTLAGVALAFVGTLLTYLFFEGIFNELNRIAGESGDAQLNRDLKEITDIYSQLGVLLGAGGNLIAGAAAAACAVMTLRGFNGARISLAVLTGCFAGWKLFCGGSWLFGAISMQESLRQEGITEAQFDTPYELLYGAVAIDFLLMVLAVVVMILLLTSAAGRYFKQGRP